MIIYLVQNIFYLRPFPPILPTYILEELCLFRDMTVFLVPCPAGKEING